MRELKFVLRFRSDAAKALKATGAGFRALNNDVARTTRTAQRFAVTLKQSGVSAAAAGAAIRKGLSGVNGVLNQVFGGALRLVSALGSIGLALGLGAAIRVLSDFGAAMSRVQAITIDTSQDLENQQLTMAALTDTARRLGATTVFTATEAAQAMAQLGQAGFKAGEIIAAVPATLNLAVAGATDLATASGIVANAVRGFGLAASEANRVADVFAATITSSNTNVVELGDALKFVAPVASNLGITIEESAAAIGLLSNAGLKSSLAGTGLRRVLVGLATQTPKATKTLRSAGIEVEKLRETIASGKGLNAALKEFEGRQLSAAQAVEVFGLRGGPAFLLLQNAATRLGSFTAALEEAQGRAEEFAKIARDNLAGDLKLLRSVIEDTIIGSGGLNTSLRNIVQTITGVIQAFRGTLDPLDENADRYRQLAQTIKTTTKFVLGFVIALKALQIFSFVLSAIGFLSKGFVELSASVGGSTLALKVFRTALITTGVGALVVAIGYLIAKYIELKNEIDPTQEQLKQTNKVVNEANELLRTTARLTGNLALEQLPRYREELKRVQAEQDATTKSLKEMNAQQEVFNRSDSGLADLFRSEQLTSGEKLSAVLKGLLPGTDALTEASNTLAEKQHELAKQGNETGRALTALKDRIDEGTKLEEAQANIERFRHSLEGLGTEIADKSKEIASFRASEDKLKDLRFDLSQAQITGTGSKLQQKINEQLNKLGLLVEVPVELKTGLVELNEKVLELQAKRADLQALETNASAQQLKDLESARAELEAQLAIAQTAQADAQQTIQLRKEERAEVIRIINAIDDAKEREKKRLETEKKLTKEREKQAELRITNRATIAALEREFTLFGLSARERERLNETEKLIASNRKIGLQGLTEEQKRIFALQDALRQQQRSDVFGNIRTQLKDFADAGTDVAARVGDSFSTLFGSVEDEIVNFVRTGKFNFRDLANSIFDEFAKLGVRLLVSGVLKKVQEALTPQEGATGTAKGLLGGLRSAAQTARAAAGFPAGGSNNKDVIGQLKKGVSTAQACCDEQVSASGALGKQVVGGLGDQGAQSRAQEQGLFGQLFSRFDQATQFLLGLLKNGFGSIKAGLGTLFERFKDGFGKLLEGLKSLGTSIADGVKSGLSKLFESLLSGISQLGTVLSKVVSSVANAVGNAIGPVVSAVGQLAGQLASALGNLLSSLASTVTQTVSSGLLLTAATELLAAATITTGAATALLAAGALLSAGSSLLVAAGTLMAAAAATLLVAATLQIVAATLMGVAAGIQIAAAVIQSVAAGLLIVGSTILVAGSILLTVSSTLLIVAALLLIAAGVISAIPGFANGGYASQPDAFVPARGFSSPMFFADGGTTTGGDRIPAMLSPNEAVVPLDNNRSIPVDMQNGNGQAQVNNITFNISTPDVAGFNKSRKQIEADMATSLHRANERNN